MYFKWNTHCNLFLNRLNFYNIIVMRLLLLSVKQINDFKQLFSQYQHLHWKTIKARYNDRLLVNCQEIVPTVLLILFCLNLFLILPLEVHIRSYLISYSYTGQLRFLNAKWHDRYVLFPLYKREENITYRAQIIVIQFYLNIHRSLIILIMFKNKYMCKRSKYSKYHCKLVWLYICSIDINDIFTQSTCALIRDGWQTGIIQLQHKHDCRFQ